MGNPDEFIRRVVREPVGLFVTGCLALMQKTMTHALLIAVDCRLLWRAVGSVGSLHLALSTRPLERRRPLRTADAQLATIKQYCAGCHNDRAKTGGVSFEGITADEHRQACRSVREGRAQAARPRHAAARARSSRTAKAVDSLVAWLEDSLDQAPQTRAHISGPGRAAPAESQGICERGSRSARGRLRCRAKCCRPTTSAEGFDNIASALQVSPSFIEQYVIAARAVAVKALGRPDARPGGWTFRAGPGTQLTHVPGLPLGTRGGILAKVDLPADGEYRHQHRRHGHPHLGQRHGVREPAGGDARQQDRLRDRDRRRRRHEALRSGAERRARSRQCPPEEHPASRRPRARTRSASTFRRQTFAESDDQLQMFAPGGGQDRSLPREFVPAAGSVRCEGPQRDAEPRAHLHLQPGNDSRDAGSCARRRSSRRWRSAPIAGR